MLRRRVITALTFVDGVLFRTKLFTPDYRYTANFVDAWSIDEIILLDVSRPENRKPELFYSVVSDFSKRCFVPVCVGGGVRSLDDIKRYLDLGADKVSVNTAALDTPELVTQAAQRFGSQCVVASIDARREGDGYRVYRNCGRERTDHAIAREEPHADELSVHLHVLDPSVRRERRPQPFLIDPGNEEVLVRVLDPEQLVAHGAADDVRVEPERADVVAGRGRHARILAAAAPAAVYRCATASISTSAPEGSFAT